MGTIPVSHAQTSKSQNSRTGQGHTSAHAGTGAGTNKDTSVNTYTKTKANDRPSKSSTT